MGIAYAFVGSLLMFVGWALAIVPSFQHLQQVALVLVLAIVGFGLALIPGGLNLFGSAGGPKRGAGTLLVSLLPAAILFVVVGVTMPIGPVFRILAFVIEALGMVIYGAAWWRATGAARSTA